MALQNLLEGILSAELEKEDGQAGLLGEALVFKIGGADLGRVLCLTYRYCVSCPRDQAPMRPRPAGQ